MKNYINGINFHDLEAQKYWAPPSSWTDEKKKETTRSRIFSGDWYGARKMDGAFYKFVKDEDGNMELLGRSKGVSGDYLNKIDFVPQLHDFFDAIPNGTCLLGEIYFPENEGSKNVTTIMGCLVDKAIARQQKGKKLHFYIFDILAFDNKSWLNLPAADRFNSLTTFSRVYTCEYVEWAKYKTGKLLWATLQDILGSGGEGIVLTRGGSLYQPGKRPSKDCQKVKKELKETIDCFFTGRAAAPTRLYTGKEIQNWKYWENVQTGAKLHGEFYNDYYDGKPIEPVTKPYYHGWAGSLEIGVLRKKEGNKLNLYNGRVVFDAEIHPIGMLSGVTEEVKANVAAYSFIPIEVTAMEIDNESKALRHGKMIGFRKDLMLEDCTFEKAFGEE